MPSRKACTRGGVKVMPAKLSDEKIRIMKGMLEAGWRGTYVAKVMGLSHTMVYRYMKRWKIARRAYRKFTR